MWVLVVGRGRVVGGAQGEEMAFAEVGGCEVVWVPEEEDQGRVEGGGVR